MWVSQRPGKGEIGGVCCRRVPVGSMEGWGRGIASKGRVCLTEHAGREGEGGGGGRDVGWEEGRVQGGGEGRREDRWPRGSVRHGRGGGGGDVGERGERGGRSRKGRIDEGQGGGGRGGGEERARGPAAGGAGGGRGWEKGEGGGGGNGEGERGGGGRGGGGRGRVAARPRHAGLDGSVNAEDRRWRASSHRRARICRGDQKIFLYSDLRVVGEIPRAVQFSSHERFVLVMRVCVGLLV